MFNKETELVLNTNRLNNIFKSLDVNVQPGKLLKAMRQYYDVPEPKKPNETLADFIFSEEKFEIKSNLTGKFFKVVWYSADNYERLTTDCDSEEPSYGSTSVVELLEIDESIDLDGIFLDSVELNNAKKTTSGWVCSDFTFKLVSA